MSMYLVDVDCYSDEVMKILQDALVGIVSTITRVDQVGEIVSDCNGYPWKRITYRYEGDIANLDIGAPVYGEYK